jgi:hypothetical protein
VILAAVAVETELGFEARLRAVRERPAVLRLHEKRVGEHEPATNSAPEPWEVHSELVLVCPDVRERARELLPERDPDAFLARPRVPDFVPAATAEEAESAASLSAAVLVYALWRFAETARTALFVFVGAVALALLAEALH